MVSDSPSNLPESALRAGPGPRRWEEEGDVILVLSGLLT